MLEARINQLQSDVVVHGQHAPVQNVKSQSSAKRVLSGKGPRSTPHKNPDIPKLGQKVAEGAPKSQHSPWMEKLKEENKKKLKKQQYLQQTLHKYIEEKLPATSRGSKGGLMAPGTSHKTIVTKAKKKKHMTLADEICAAMSSSVASTTANTAKVVPHKTSKRKQKDSKNEVLSKDGQNEAVNVAQDNFEELEMHLHLPLSQRTSVTGSSSEPQQKNRRRSSVLDIHQSIRSYLEACVFAEDIERAHRFLLSQHKIQSRRKYLNTDLYNVMMKVWAKKVSSALCLFKKSFGVCMFSPCLHGFPLGCLGSSHHQKCARYVNW